MLQVQVLTEQVAAQGEKIGELERNVTEKQHQLNTADDLLRRVSLFANSVGVQIDKQKVPEKELINCASPMNIISVIRTHPECILSLWLCAHFRPLECQLYFTDRLMIP